ncbi:hypothetical protein EIP91_009627 [Steccherinum ochraceum]|uniref:Protein kinase domain-containing protein n=1 Tax=Steccherinum ochraceum TaxID=92696 RepID=A0A4R0R1G0_9APHY|nr:hypothetical protein EIP91_009627 [Steccherinum ochraceum]
MGQYPDGKAERRTLGLTEEEARFVFDELWRSPSSRPTSTAVLSFQEAQSVIDEVWRLLDVHVPASQQAGSGASPDVVSRRGWLRQFCIKIALALDIFPITFVLRDVRRVQNNKRIAGGFADVYQGMLGDRMVALKCPRIYHSMSDAEKLKAKQGFSRESLLWKGLVHEHVLPFLGVSDVIPDTICMVMPWMSHGSLRHYIEAQRGKGELVGDAYALAMGRWLLNTVRGLEYLHEQDIVHGDLHGGNLLVKDDGSICLTDFGLAVIAEGTPYGAGSLHGGGAVHWQAPELFDPETFGLNNRRPTFQSDVYSFACTCIELYSMKPPLHELSVIQLMRKVVAGTRPPRPILPDGGKRPTIRNLVTKLTPSDSDDQTTLAGISSDTSTLREDTTLAAHDEHDTAFDSLVQSSLAQPYLSPSERSALKPQARTEPHLQFMAGPLLRYDTVTPGGIWRGAVLIVTVDAGSIYEPLPSLTYTLPDPYATKHLVTSQELWVYSGSNGTYTFWRFIIEIPLGPAETKIGYCINNGQRLQFTIPGRNQNMRWAAYSSNDFTPGVNPDEFRGPGFASGYDPVWIDLLQKHAEQPFHVLTGVGDQLYSDTIVREPEMQEWLQCPPERRKTFPLTAEILQAIDRFYFNHYCRIFRSGAFAKANSSIPMLNMLAQMLVTWYVHFRITSCWLTRWCMKITGFGSYTEDIMRSPIFSTIGSRGYFYFLLFQCCINYELDGMDEQNHMFKSAVIGGPGRYVPFPSHSFVSYLGPHTNIVLLDCRSERTLDQLSTQSTYSKMFERIISLPKMAEHLVISIASPIAYPRVASDNSSGTAVSSLFAQSRGSSTGISGLLGRLSIESEDLVNTSNELWISKSHKYERQWFVEQLQQYSLKTGTRISFLSGTVQCAGIGILKSLVKGRSKQEVAPPLDHRYMMNIIIGPIVDASVPNSVLSLKNFLATKTHKALHDTDTDETMVPLFVVDTNGSQPKSKHVMGKRNWCSVERDPTTGDIIFDIRVEKEKGNGETVSYAIRAPPPQWYSARLPH